MQLRQEVVKSLKIPGEHCHSKLTSRHDTPTGEEDTPTGEDTPIGEEDTPTYFHNHVFIYRRCFTWSVASVRLMQLPRGRDHRPQRGVTRGRVFELTPLVAAWGVGVVHG